MHVARLLTKLCLRDRAQAVILADETGLLRPDSYYEGLLSRTPRHGDTVLDLTVTIDHNVVDGAPATRFGTDLRELLHTAAALRPTRPG